MGLRPTQGDEKRVLFSNHTQRKRRPPFVISTGAPKERSGEICGVSGPSLGGRSQGDEAGPVQRLLLPEAPPSPLSSRPEESWAFVPPKAMKRVLFSNCCCRKPRPPLCHLDRSAAEWRYLRCQRPFPGNVFRQSGLHPLSCRPSPGQTTLSKTNPSQFCCIA